MSEFDFNSNNEQEISDPTEKESPDDLAANTKNKLTHSNIKFASFFKGLIEQTELIVLAFAIIILIFSFVGRTCEVNGSSMYPTLQHEENVLISNLFYTPKRYDIIVFHQTNENSDLLNEPIVKRVIGLPGETVKIEHLEETMKVTIISPDGNAEVLEESYIQYAGMRIYPDSITYVEEGTVFVLGDNRCRSTDSRSSEIGLVDTRRILGKVILRITPFSSFGAVK